MFDDLVVHPDTLDELARASKSESHALLLEGPAHIGKSTMAQVLAAQLLQTSAEKLQAMGKFLQIDPEGQTISVEEIRGLNHFFSLKQTGHRAVNRVACIIDAERMNHVAQNALLKLLEEPPEDTVIILTSSQGGALLPTIHSRVQRIVIKKPSKDQIIEYFKGSYESGQIEKALALGAGVIGPTQEILSSDATSMVNVVREMLALNLYDQLMLIETTLKDKTAALEFVKTLSQLAAISLRGAVKNQAAAAQWKRISRAAYAANEALNANANAKLVLTELMLSLRA